MGMDRIEDLKAIFQAIVKKVRRSLGNRDSPENWPSGKVATRSASPGFSRANGEKSGVLG